MIRKLRAWWDSLDDPPSPKEFARINIRKLREMPPGQIHVIEDRNGNKWAVMHYDDFEHLANSASLRLVPATDSASDDANG